MTRIFHLVSILFAILLMASACSEGQPEDHLSAEEIDFLEELNQKYLCDPNGKTFITFRAKRPNAYGRMVVEDDIGWLEESTDSVQWVHLQNGGRYALQPGEEWQEADLENYQKGLPAAWSGKMAYLDNYTGRMRPQPEIIAAWAYRLGRYHFAKEALNPKPSFHPRRSFRPITRKLFQSHYWTLLHHFAIGDQDVALESANYLTQRLEKEYLMERLGYQVKRIREQLVRQPESSHTEPAPEPPPQYESWPTTVKADFLIEQLEHVSLRHQESNPLPGDFQDWDQKKQLRQLLSNLDDVIQSGNEYQPLFFYKDWRVRELIQLGDAVVPRLLGVINNDERMTRMLDFETTTHLERRVISVREVAIEVLMTVAQWPFYAPYRDESDIDVIRRRLVDPVPYFEAFWDSIGHLPFTERMTQLAANHATSKGERCQALRNLTLGDSWTYYGIDAALPNRVSQHPPIDAADKSEVIELLFRFYDQYSDSARIGLWGEIEPISERDVDRIHSVIDPLFERLEDRFAPLQIAERSLEATEFPVALAWAGLATRLGETKAMDRIAVRAANANWEDSDSFYRLTDLNNRNQLTAKLIDELAQCQSVHCKDALVSMRSSSNALHWIWAGELAGLTPENGSYPPPFSAPSRYTKPSPKDSLWLSQTAYLHWLSRKLFDEFHLTCCDSAYVRDSTIHLKRQHLPLSDVLDGYVHARLTKGKALSSQDRTARRIWETTLGLPPYFALFSNRDSLLSVYKDYFTHFTEFETLDRETAHFIGPTRRPTGTFYYPKFDLRAPATQQDVESGCALFSLGDSAWFRIIDPPWVIELDERKLDGSKIRALVIQAEVDKNGMLHLGTVSRVGIRVVTTSFDQLETLLPSAHTADRSGSTEKPT